MAGITRMDRALVKLQKEKDKARNTINTYRIQIQMSQAKALNDVADITNRIKALEVKSEAIVNRSIRIVNGYNSQIEELEKFINE